MEVRSKGFKSFIKELRQKIVKIFVGFLEYEKPWKIAFEINWPLNNIVYDWYHRLVVLILLNNGFLRERGMTSNPKMEYQVFLCIFQKKP